MLGGIGRPPPAPAAYREGQPPLQPHRHRAQHQGYDISDNKRNKQWEKEFKAQINACAHACRQKRSLLFPGQFRHPFTCFPKNLLWRLNLSATVQAASEPLYLLNRAAVKLAYKELYRKRKSCKGGHSASYHACPVSAASFCKLLFCLLRSLPMGWPICVLYFFRTATIIGRFKKNILFSSVINIQQCENGFPAPDRQSPALPHLQCG